MNENTTAATPQTTLVPDMGRPGRKGNTLDNIRTLGTIYKDEGSKGYSKSGRRRFKDCWRAEISIAGQRYRHRGESRLECEEWLKAVTTRKIKPTDNKADWYRMEQKKDPAVRVDELIVSNAEEAVLIYNYHETGDMEPLFKYCEQRLLPHMAYYCAHTLRFSQERTITASREAVAILLQRIANGNPVFALTITAKKMLRTHMEKGHFWFWERIPEPIRLRIGGLDLSGLAEIWKVTRDRRL